MPIWRVTKIGSRAVWSYLHQRAYFPTVNSEETRMERIVCIRLWIGIFGRLARKASQSQRSANCNAALHTRQPNWVKWTWISAHHRHRKWRSVWLVHIWWNGVGANKNTLLHKERSSAGLKKMRIVIPDFSVTVLWMQPFIITSEVQLKSNVSNLQYEELICATQNCYRYPRKHLVYHRRAMFFRNGMVLANNLAML